MGIDKVRDDLLGNGNIDKVRDDLLGNGTRQGER